MVIEHGVLYLTALQTNDPRLRIKRDSAYAIHNWIFPFASSYIKPTRKKDLIASLCLPLPFCSVTLKTYEPRSLEIDSLCDATRPMIICDNIEFAFEGFITLFMLLGSSVV
ncbi:hypothetical protein TNCT_641821 [Trichonephila clavata]|uniref:Uncharacterized protein n=1 Tax=Trichonephila clavata TaxID=2740835 RepID=A0A8X6L889_TRICU|nr:hypothetical protein TNCT_641821 [Trichonephila clavata]